MEKSQFIFSVAVGVGLIVLGNFMLSEASVGISLITLGMALISIALLNKFYARTTRNRELSLLPVRVEKASKQSLQP